MANPFSGKQTLVEDNECGPTWIGDTQIVFVKTKKEGSITYKATAVKKNGKLLWKYERLSPKWHRRMIQILGMRLFSAYSAIKLLFKRE